MAKARWRKRTHKGYAYSVTEQPGYHRVPILKRRLRVHPMGWELVGRHCSAVGRTPEEAWRLYSQLRREIGANDALKRPLSAIPERVTRNPVPLVWDVPVKRKVGLLERLMAAVPLFRVPRPTWLHSGPGGRY